MTTSFPGFLTIISQSHNSNSSSKSRNCNQEMSVLYNSLSLVLYTALVFTLAGSSAVTQAAPGHGQIARDHFSTELSFDQTLCPFVQRYFFSVFTFFNSTFLIQLTPLGHWRQHFSSQLWQFNWCFSINQSNPKWQTDFFFSASLSWRKNTKGSNHNIICCFFQMGQHEIDEKMISSNFQWIIQYCVYYEI